MKSTCMTIIAAIVLGVALPARAGSDVEEGAAASLAALAVTGLITEAATRSSLDVTVEMFRETEGGNEPFVVKNPPALYRSIHDSSNTLLTAAQASHLNSALEPRMEHIKAIAIQVDAYVVGLQSTAHGAAIGEVISDLQQVSLRQKNAYSSWTEFRDTYKKTCQSGRLSTADREKLQLIAEDLNFKLEQIPTRYSTSSVEQLIGLVQGAYYNIRMKSPEEPGKASARAVETQKNDDLLEKARQEASSSEQAYEQVAIMLDATRKILLAEPGIKNDIANCLTSLGISITPETLMAFNNREDITSALRDTAGTSIIAAAAASRDALMTLNSGIATTVNTGPLANEMTQGILAQSEILDKITDPRNSKLWVPFNKAATAGRLGNHNAVVYMDNAATPVLKKATFDPSAFIKAHGMMYTRAFKTSAALFGAPGELPANTASASNVFALKAKEMTVDDAESARRTVLLKSLLALTTQLKKVQDAAGNQATVNETKKIVAEVAQSLTPTTK